MQFSLEFMQKKYSMNILKKTNIMMNNNSTSSWINEYSSPAHTCTVDVLCGMVTQFSSSFSNYSINNQCVEPSLNLDVIDFMQSWELLKMMTNPKQQLFNRKPNDKPSIQQMSAFNNIQCTNISSTVMNPIDDHDDDMKDTPPHLSKSHIVFPSPQPSTQLFLSPTETLSLTLNTSPPQPFNNHNENSLTNTISNTDTADKVLLPNLESYQFLMSIKNPYQQYVDQSPPSSSIETSMMPLQQQTNVNNTFNDNRILKRKRKISNVSSFESEKRKTSSSSSSSSTSNVSSIGNNSSLSTTFKTPLNNCIVISNPKHLKRRRKYQKRKNSANTNPAQTQMEFHFPVWTFHLE
ncbi:predicted protein [Naegleria gruberi]|uniref:Predicted protein n=1 Tax=Naegleria gruberi TaxID=5762 RepID=D2VY74_NAEGR|nr:uncharacterized protein NAEGRDRAFT_53197 [Naegleria gruberi]EFC38150.1 predicted protein [Naegleria gruberi]|eukprot:XP_002670894.1 predicted protein [Naegleria gruberi strain NEG-M]